MLSICTKISVKLGCVKTVAKFSEQHKAWIMDQELQIFSVTSNYFLTTTLSIISNNFNFQEELSRKLRNQFGVEEGFTTALNYLQNKVKNNIRTKCNGMR